MINLKTLEETSIVCDKNPKIHKYYVYTYTLNGKVKYVGRGSDAHLKGNQYYRARHIKGHDHSPECSSESGNLLVTIVDHASTIEEAKLIEANYIKAFGTVENGWNNIKGLKDNKFYDLLDTFIKREDGSSIDVKTLVHLLMQNATGEKGVEPKELARDIISKVDIDEDKDICVISNNQFGGFNLVKELINPEIEKKSLNMIVTEEFAMKIGADDMADKEFLTINTGHENFIDQTFDKKFDIIFMNPPWGDGWGRKFIDKARSLLKKGGKLITIIGYNQFTMNEGPGSFLNLQQFGTFERIETFKGMFMDRDYFTKFGLKRGVRDWCWFIWRNENIDLNTTIINRLGEEFKYGLLGNEHYVPQLPNELDYFDWSLPRERPKEHSANSKATKEGAYVILRNNSNGPSGKDTDPEFTDVKRGDDIRRAGVIFYDKSASVLKKLDEDIGLYNLYGDSSTGDKARTPPLKKDLGERT